MLFFILKIMSKIEGEKLFDCHGYWGQYVKKFVELLS